MKNPNLYFHCRFTDSHYQVSFNTDHIVMHIGDDRNHSKMRTLASAEASVSIH